MAAKTTHSSTIFAENRSKNDGTRTPLEGSNGAPGSVRLDQIIRSDSLPHMSALCERSPFFHQVVDKTLQIRLVLDANIVQRELRWRVGSRQKQEAKTALHEAIEAGVIVALAPTALEEEINEHVADIANYANVSQDRVPHDWSKFRTFIHFYHPQLTHPTDKYFYPNDIPHSHTLPQLVTH